MGWGAVTPSPLPGAIANQASTMALRTAFKMHYLEEFFGIRPAFSALRAFITVFLALLMWILIP